MLQDCESHINSIFDFDGNRNKNDWNPESDKVSIEPIAPVE